MIEAPDLLAYLREEADRSLDSDMMHDIEAAIASYKGEPYGDEVEGLSQVVTRDVAETVDWMLPSILRVLFSSDRIAELEADSPDLADMAEQATEKLHDDMRRRSYRLIYDFVKAGLLEKVGLIKTCIERKRERQELIVPDVLIPEDAIAAEPTGEFDEFANELWRVAVIADRGVEIVDYNVPFEEFRVSPDARDFETAPYLAHVVEKTISDLVQMGFDNLEGLDDDEPTYRGEFRDEHRSRLGDDRSGAMRKVWLHEEYVRFDMDGDGIAERLKVFRVGNTILEVETVDYQPFEYWTPFRMQGRLFGDSLADKTMDLQRQTTILKRNALNSLYFSTAPGTLIDEGAIGDNTIDDLLTVTPGRIVRFKGVPPIPEQRNDTSQTAFAAIEQLNGERESRTGITRMNQGLDKDQLNKTATGTALMQAAGQLIEESLAREVAEAIARWFSRKYKFMREYGQPFMLRVDGEYIQADPAEWPEIVDVKVRVGLGSGRKDERLEYRRELLAAHETLALNGSPLTGPEVQYKLLSGQARDMGFNPAECFIDPSTVEQGPEQPDPAMIEAQMKAQIEQAKLEAKAEADFAKVQAKAQSDMMDHQRKMEADLSKAQLEAMKAQHKAQLDEAKLAHEQRMAEIRTMYEQRLAAQKAEFEQRMKVEVSDNREGGDLSK